MKFVTQIKWLLGSIFRKQQLESTLDIELRTYMEEMVERKLRDGLEPVEARRQAMVEAGGLEQVKEQVRETWRGNVIQTGAQDIRCACRQLIRSPGFSAVVILTMALGIGTNVSMYSVMHSVLWRPLPYPAADRIVTVQVNAQNVNNAGAAPGEVLDIRMRSRLLEHVAMISSADANLDFGNELEHLAAASVSDDLLPLLGAEPALGRSFRSSIDSAEMVHGVIISDDLWRRRFGSDPTIVGRGVHINNQEMQVVGVLRPSFRLFLPPSVSASEQIDIWFPTRTENSRQYRGFAILGRLKPGVTLAQANAELQALAAQFIRENSVAYPNSKLHLVAQLLHSQLTQEARPALYLLAGAVGLVLLIACVNVANIMLARATARQREVAIRRALGAGSVRLIRQLLTESLVLALIAGGAGLILAHISLTVITKLGGLHLPMQSRIIMDDSVILFTVLLSIGTSLLFGLLPAWRLASDTRSESLRAGRTETATPTMRMLQRTLIVAEIALSVVPLVCGGLMLRTFLNLVHAPIGFNTSDVLTAKLPISFRRYPTINQRWLLYRNVLQNVGTLPGVEAVSAASPLPFTTQQISTRVSRADRTGIPGILATQQVAMHGYLRLMGTPLLQGRDFTPEDISFGRQIAIVDKQLAQSLWPEGAIGRHLTLESLGTRQELEIVGVTAPVRVTRLRDDHIPHFFVPYHVYPIEMSLVVKTPQAAASIGPLIQKTVNALHTGRAAFDIRPLSAYVADSISDTRFLMLVLGVFATESLLLASVGLYGTLAYLMSQRTREFGIRLALGSSVRNLIAIVIGEGTMLTAVGTAVGLIGASATTGAIRQFLYDVNPFDSVTLLGVVALVVFITIVAASLPAWRAAHIDPNVSLRSE